MLCKWYGLSDNPPRAAIAVTALFLAAASHADTLPATTLADMSFEDLGNVTVTSVSKQPEPLETAPAAIYVIRRDDILQSGATTIPEMLRLAPNLQVAQSSTGGYNIAARGFSGNAADQNFSNKLLVLIDGRSVYSPLFSGVYWDMQNVLPDDIERIEVVSGPGATLWGANAFNGVINIITRGAADTPGGLITAEAGTLNRDVSLQYGGRLAEDLSYRVYATGYDHGGQKTSKGADAHDGMSNAQAGFRADWTPASNSFTVQGDLYRGPEQQGAAPDTRIDGENFLARWQHRFEGGSTLQIQAYFDEAERFSGGGGSGFVVDSYDVDIQHSLNLGSWNSILWGGGERISRYNIDNTATLQFSPTRRTLSLGNVFVQDGIALSDKLTLILGMKGEDDPYSGLVGLPDARLSWKVADNALLWSAVSRAVRSPTPFDRDVIEYIGATKFLIGGPDFKSEKLTAYELGYRMEPISRLSFSLSTFYNRYDDLRSTEFGPRVLPLQWGNMMEGNTYGVEVWGNCRVTDWWRLTAGFNVQHENLRLRPGSGGLLGIAQAGDDPAYKASLQSLARLSDELSWSAELRSVGALPNPAVPAYTELDTRLAWALDKALEFSVSGFNLLHDHHQELTEIGNDRIGRSFTVAVSRRF